MQVAVGVSPDMLGSHLTSLFDWVVIAFALSISSVSVVLSTACTAAEKQRKSSVSLPYVPLINLIQLALLPLGAVLSQ
jgi:hypothetical protein